MGWQFKWSARRDTPTPPTAPKKTPGDECTHDWTNWTDPVSVDSKTHVGSLMWGGEVVDVQKWQQDRRCIKCNLAQRTFA